MALTHRTVAMMMPVTDVDRARTFYSESLGLDYTGTNDEGSATYALDGGSTLVLLERRAQGPKVTSCGSAAAWRHPCRKALPAPARRT